MGDITTASEKTSTLLLCSATAIFLERGFDGTRMQEIADRAGVNKALLHYYFRNKQTLFEAVVRHQFKSNIMQLLKDLHPDATFAAALRHFINGYVDTLAANPQVPRFMLRELAGGGQAVAQVLREMINAEEISVIHHLRRLMNRAARRGEIRRQDPLQLVMTVIGACIYSFIAEPIIVAVEPDFAKRDQHRFLASRKRAIFQTIYYGTKKRESHEA